MTGFLPRYLPKFYRVEQRRNATLVIRGLLLAALVWRSNRRALALLALPLL